MELNADQELAALEGWAANGAVPPAERLAAALQVIQSLHVRERMRTREAVAATLRYMRVYWAGDDGRVICGVMAHAEELVRVWDMAPGWCCPFCEEVTCDDDCPLARVRTELEAL